MEPGHELMHLPGGGERTLVDDVEPPLAGIDAAAFGKMGLQRGGLDSGRVAQV
jgi:hypothetical protein